MILFVVLGAMTVIAIAFLVLPLLRRRDTGPSRKDYDLEIYRDQLRELERDVERGVVAAGEAEAARVEIERRMLAAKAPAEEENARAASEPRTANLLVAFAVGVVVPLAAGGLYLWQGMPGLESKPYAAREAERAAAAANNQAPNIEEMVARLAARLERQPDDIQGWMMLARSYGVLERYSESIAALKRAVEISNNDPGVVALLGEARVFAAEGVVTPDAKKDFRAALKLDPSEPAARFYLALAKAQAGDTRGALDDWIALERDTPADAPYLASLRARIDAAAKSIGIDVSTLRPPPKPAATPPAGTGPSQADIAAAKDMSPSDQKALIRGMVDRLAQRLEGQPDDLKGWVQLARSYRVLGEKEKARDAYARAAALAPKDAGVLQGYATALIEAAPDGAPLTEQAVGVIERLAALDGENPQVLWLLGRVAAEKGDTARARDLWQRLLAKLSPGSADSKAIQQAIDSLAKTSPDG